MFVWTEEYSVGVRELDEQHRHFLEIANNVLILAAKPEVSKNELLIVLGKFLDYALYHLDSEEECFKTYDCPQVGHIEAHNLFKVRFKELFSRVEADDSDHILDAKAAADFAGKWILQHILVMDKGYTYCFHEHGLH